MTVKSGGPYYLHVFSVYDFNCSWAVVIDRECPPVVSNVVATQRPGTSLVDLTYDLSGSTGASATLRSFFPTTAVPPIGEPLSLVAPSDCMLRMDRLKRSFGMRLNSCLIPFLTACVSVSLPSSCYLLKAWWKFPQDLLSWGTRNSSSIYELQHTVSVSGFLMGKYEVTWGLWQEVRDWAIINGYDSLQRWRRQGERSSGTQRKRL